MINEKYRIPREAISIEDRIQVFKQTSLVIRRSNLRLGDTIGHGEFGGKLYQYIKITFF